MVGFGLRCRWEINFSIKLFDYLLGYNKAQAYAVSVQPLSGLYEPKQFEKFVLIIVRNANSSIHDPDIQELNTLFLCNFNFDSHSSSLCELKSIRLQVKEDLHNPLLVSVHQRTVDLSLPRHLLWVSYVEELGLELQLLLLRLFPLDAHYFFDGLSNVEFFYVFSEVSRPYLRVIKDVLDEEAH